MEKVVLAREFFVLRAKAQELLPLVYQSLILAQPVPTLKWRHSLSFMGIAAGWPIGAMLVMLSLVEKPWIAWTRCALGTTNV
ncbi:MAG: hypothetical protein JSS71_10380 [Armatimonadetes bacterium]|nr:hypothetical protein [Armatimonadota bacterium]MBX3107827.1 hypothetical protein [Fimbriimonadaceae bacterium]